MAGGYSPVSVGGHWLSLSLGVYRVQFVQEDSRASSSRAPMFFCHIKCHWVILENNEPITRQSSCDLEEVAGIPTDGPGFCHVASFHLGQSHPQQMDVLWRKKNEDKGLGTVIWVAVAVASASGQLSSLTSSRLSCGEQAVGCGPGDGFYRTAPGSQMLMA